jgi:hypothetical protein
MAKDLVERNTMTAIGNAIRSKLNNSTRYKPSEMAGAILSIPEGYPEPAGTISITQNGTQNVKDYASASVAVPNCYAAGDEGKVVSNGALVAQTARAAEITQNGSYDTTLNDEVTVNVSGGGGGETEEYVGDFTPGSNANTAKSGGWQFTTKSGGLKIKGVRFFPRDSTCDVFISDANGNTVASKTGVTVTADQWNDIDFDNTVTLDANTTYVVWGSNASVAMKYLNASISPNLVTYIKGLYSASFSTFPTTNEYGTAYGVDMIALVPAAGIPTLTEAQWNALTTAQKQAYGLVGIIKSATGFERGDLVNGADYVETGQ